MRTVLPFVAVVVLCHVPGWRNAMVERAAVDSFVRRVATRGRKVGQASVVDVEGREEEQPVVIGDLRTGARGATGGSNRMQAFRGYEGGGTAVAGLERTHRNLLGRADCRIGKPGRYRRAHIGNVRCLRAGGPHHRARLCENGVTSARRRVVQVVLHQPDEHFGYAHSTVAADMQRQSEQALVVVATAHLSFQMVVHDGEQWRGLRVDY